MKSIPIPYQGKTPYKLEISIAPRYTDGEGYAGDAVTVLGENGLWVVEYTPPGTGGGSASSKVRLGVKAVPLDFNNYTPLNGGSESVYLEFGVLGGGDGGDGGPVNPAPPVVDPSGLPLGAVQRDPRCTQRDLNNSFDQGIDMTGTVKRSCTWATSDTFTGIPLVKGNIHAYEFRIAPYDDFFVPVKLREGVGAKTISINVPVIEAAPTWKFLITQGSVKTLSFSDRPFDMNYDWAEQVPGACRRLHRETSIYGGDFRYGCQLGTGVWYLNIAYEGEFDRDTYNIQMYPYW
jgi:hypothetical protein